MSKHLILITMFVVASCGGGQTKPKDPEKGPIPAIPPELIIEIYDALPTLELSPSTSGWEKALSQATKHAEHILIPLNERLEFLARKVIVRPGEATTPKSRQERADHYKKYINLRRAYAKIVSVNPTPRGLAVLIRFLDQDVPEGKQVLEKFSGESFGFDRARWSRWYTASQVRKGTADTRQAVNDYLAADNEARLEILKTYMTISKELRIQTLSERFTEHKGGGKVTTKDLEKLRLQALAVFIEGLKSIQVHQANMALVGLVQLGAVAEDAVIDMIESTAPLAARLRGISVLGNRNSLSAANKLIELSTNDKFRSAALQSIGNLDLKQEHRKIIASGLEKSMSKTKSATDAQKVLAALVLMGETDRYPLLLSQCPDDPKSKIYIYSRDVKDPAWLQMRRIARKTLDRQIEMRNRNTPSWQQNNTGAFNPEAEFHRYVKYHKLTLSRENWKVWSKKVLQKMP